MTSISLHSLDTIDDEDDRALPRLPVHGLDPQAPGRLRSSQRRTRLRRGEDTSREGGAFAATQRRDEGKARRRSERR